MADSRHVGDQRSIDYHPAIKRPLSDNALSIHDNDDDYRNEVNQSPLPKKKIKTVGQQKRFSLRYWVRNTPWSQYFKDGCRLIIKSPLNFFIFFCCFSVVVWGAFLVLLMGNLAKLRDDATQKLWIEIASQVLNGFFTLANVPVHPKRFLGLIRGYRIWTEDKKLRNHFVSRFLNGNNDRDGATMSNKNERRKELLRMLDFYFCFPDYGRERQKKLGYLNEGALLPTPMSAKASRKSSESFIDRAGPRSKSISNPKSHQVDPYRAYIDYENTRDYSAQGTSLESSAPLQHLANADRDKPKHSCDNSVVATSRTPDQVNITEEFLNLLLAEETHRVVHSVILPFLPTSVNVETGENSCSEPLQQLSLDTGVASQSMGSRGSPVSQARRRLDRGSSYTSLSRMSMKRAFSRGRARTMSMTMTTETGVPRTFVVHDDDSFGHNKSLTEDQTQLFMPPSLTLEQMDWVDKQQERLLQQQERLQKAWPWYTYTMPSGIEPVDFFSPEPQPEESELSQPPSTSKPAIGLSRSPTDLIISPSRFCLIVGSFNVNSLVQEILCGFMWGMSYHVRPGWVVGTGMALGCIAAIVPSVLIMLHERRLSRMRIVAVAEVAIQDALDDKRGSF
ncbi:hypothetical protein BCR41DRAFT_29937 [Lobosporangium transversale]|uniref:Uncharacterized protein n=1 Tax=Lobosporangium transversale TaxID=64571 RepID=A0A1Y2GSA5_9FUNG|nr:hypothetical protein BCR41DRAFT_29937 [Lobosporangium transversale]ORZ21018.1 hypothetical protein BCR41DRAFT_29937 [Lobosporangium transversale]|eukprot:XP_021882927.1 hypothetical protein BCR41DRAFT_29937 [Lobosporangium transversale]